ncbi:MAG: polysaccharide deacetylase family protein [Clostridiales bacterium]|jgi:peptidoglycan/xylan/chitin deacetylase (PgdA/CDA1 family)|nr:polysaccharide deacetylase family protein [Clostridiales bacterium]
MQPVYYLFPNGGREAVTFSYDDGRAEDRRLVEVFNRFGMKGTFHLNTGTLGAPGYLTAEECSAIFEGHEIAAHSVSHPFLSQQPAEASMTQLIEDRARLEDMAGYPVRGFSYPFGDFGGGAPALLKAAGFDYARTVNATDGVLFPDDFMLWGPSCHHKNTEAAMRMFTRKRSWKQLRLLYIWGHSFEFEDDGWGLIEDICGRLNEMPGLWRAANGEIFDYVTAMRSMRWSVDGSMAFNPSHLDVLIEKDGAAVALKPGLNRL